MYIYIYIYTFTCTYTYIHVCIYLCMYISWKAATGATARPSSSTSAAGRPAELHKNSLNYIYNNQLSHFKVLQTMLMKFEVF